MINNNIFFSQLLSSVLKALPPIPSKTQRELMYNVTGEKSIKKAEEILKNNAEMQKIYLAQLGPLSKLIQQEQADQEAHYKLYTGLIGTCTCAFLSISLNNIIPADVNTILQIMAGFFANFIQSGLSDTNKKS